MSLLQSICLEHLPPSYSIHIALYRNLTNAAFLHQQLLAGNTDFEYAMVEPTVIVSKKHILSASYRAINDLLENRLRSRNVHSEIVFSLSPNNNIAESFRRFGITPTSTSLLVVKVSTPESHLTASQIQDHLSSVIEGEQVSFSDDELLNLTDWTRVKKIYKLNSASGGGKKVNNVNEVEEQKDEKGEIEVMVLGSMALRGATN